MILKASKLGKTYAQGSTQISVLRELDLEIKAHETVAVLGRSGSGKSTLLSLLAGLDVPDSGQVELAGTSIGGLSDEERALLRGQKIGIVFQQFHLIQHLTALENVMLPLEIQEQSEAEERATKILKELGLGERLHHLPSQLSGGECQRVAIARALVTEPELLLADEPSGNLDAKTGEEVMDLLFKTVADRGLSALFVTHSSELAKRCARRLSLEEGRLVAQS